MSEYKIEPYDTDLGVFWRVLQADTGEIIEDVFDSSADAEDWIHEHKSKKDG